MDKYQYALNDIKDYSFDTERLKDDFDTLQELIDKTTICGLSLDEAIPVIEMYKQLKQTTNQLEPITD